MRHLKCSQYIRCDGCGGLLTPPVDFAPSGCLLRGLSQQTKLRMNDRNHNFWQIIQALADLLPHALHA
jgi:hypothetical protein